MRVRTEPRVSMALECSPVSAHLDTPVNVIIFIILWSSLLSSLRLLLSFYLFSK